MVKDYHGLHFDDDVLIAIGRIAANFSHLDYLLSRCVCKLISPKAIIGAIVTDKMSYKNKVDLFKFLYKDSLEGKVDSDFNTLISNLHNAGSKRNDVLHSMWARYENGRALRINYSKLNSLPIIFDINEFNKAVDLITKVDGEVFKIFGKLMKIAQ
ncbi:hypothetical protein ACFLTP_07725 [Chloroflexota bacterium]